jgi:hypothetical protein
VNVVCCQEEVSATGWSLVQRSPTECGVSECDREASIIRRPWPTRGCCAIGKKCCTLTCFVLWHGTWEKFCKTLLYSLPMLHQTSQVIINMFITF